MGLFSSHVKVDMEDFCRNYYDTQMFHSLVKGEDASQKILDASYQLLTDSDSSFRKINKALFEQEMTAMHLEIFALVFFIRFTNVNHSVKQGIFTMQYLYNKQMNNIWESMGHYNQIVARIATLGMTENTASNRMAITYINSMRTQICENWCKENKLDTEVITKQDKEKINCLGRVANRFGVDIMKNQELGNRLITSSFLYRLGAEDLFGKEWKPSSDFLTRLASQSYSIYDFATSVLKNVDLRFS